MNIPTMIPSDGDMVDKDYYFRDGKRRIDFILVYMQRATQVEEEECRSVVNSFLTKMEGLGLQFETEMAIIDPKLTFIKVHTPLEVLYYHAKVHNVKLEKHNFNMQHKARKSLGFSSLFGQRNSAVIQRLDSESVLSKRPNQPTNCERIFITHKIMNSYDDNSGYQMLINAGQLYSAYPLHDGGFDWTSEGILNDRQMLNKYWSNFSVFYKKQPLHLINRYFGSAIAFYFAWMGFYIKALSTIFLIGIATTIYSVITLNTRLNDKSEIFCKATDIICAKCSNFDLCPFTYLNSSCKTSKWNYFIENDSVIFNAILLSLWGTVYFVFWRRYENTLSYMWNLYDLRNEVTLRAQYPRSTTYRRISPYTKQLEPYTPKKEIVFKYFVSVCVMFVMILLVFVVLLSVIAFRVFAYPVTDPQIYLIDDDMELYKTISGTFAAIVFILIFEMTFEVICLRLTQFTNPRTNKEYDERLILKLFMFGFINGFSHLIYGSFVKSRMHTYPGSNYDTFLSMMKLDTCEIDDCIMDICFQLVGIVLATALLRTTREIIGPVVLSWRKYRKAIKQKVYEEEVPVWEKDLYKSSFRRYNLVYSYKHIILQYGYITLFAAIFPITPFLSLVYNIVEIRADAIKLIRLFRRPIPYRKKGIGAWNTILEFMTMISVITNMLIISFTSDFVERMIAEKNAEKVKPRILSNFSTNDYIGWNKNKYKTPFPNITQCLYFSDRHSPNSTSKYQPRVTNLYTISCRLLVFLILEHVILFLSTIVEMIVPQMPLSIQEQMHKVRLFVIEREEFKADMLN